MKSLLNLIIKSFLQGLVILGPIGVTIYAIYFVFTKLDSLLPFMSEWGTGLSFITIIVLIIVIGYLGTKFFLAKIFLNFFDHILESIPGIKHIYTSVKDVLASFVGDKKKFNIPVWVKVNDAPALWRIGFLTQESIMISNRELVSVYLPHAYAISGWVITIDKSEITLIEDMTAAEAMKFAVSGGITKK